MLKQEISSKDLANFSNALGELIANYHERPAEEFKKLASEIIEDFDSTLFDNYGYMPCLLKQELLAQYMQYRSK